MPGFPFRVVGYEVSGDVHLVSVSSSGAKPASHSHSHPNCLNSQGSDFV